MRFFWARLACSQTWVEVAGWSLRESTDASRHAWLPGGGTWLAGQRALITIDWPGSRSNPVSAATHGRKSPG